MGSISSDVAGRHCPGAARGSGAIRVNQSGRQGQWRPQSKSERLVRCHQRPPERLVRRGALGAIHQRRAASIRAVTLKLRSGGAPQVVSRVYVLRIVYMSTYTIGRGGSLGCKCGVLCGLARLAWAMAHVHQPPGVMAGGGLGILDWSWLGGSGRVGWA